jgi:tRNA dimethylallyltransferase
MVMMAIPARAMRRLSETQVQFKPVIVMVGPTAVGKSRVAIAVAKAFETEVLTADSRHGCRDG